ncbi:hypothetical protein OKW76_12915 [Sphingomonas sp. S1-29]|uniref:AbiTii domain-containing protein n=1 Tax=Sphingomonas sp. S1-29 TaxID=2991074 RepID=UPI00223FFC02|nr:hypothetical protein [Sphingomonas sp. S1-29]UZK68926.1 hypothetical protein OKW76_12915 [Sphingomonas sp. S1-29]
MNLVEQLQAEAIDQSVPLSTLLRKAKLIASKLSLQGTVDWIDAELQGYGQDIADYPPYRHVKGRVMVFSPWHGWRSPGGNPKIIEALATRQVADSVSALEHIIAQDPSGNLSLDIDLQVQAEILKGNPGWTEVHTQIQQTALVAILDHVRTLVLNWALELEEKGIAGQGVRFTEQEQLRAQSASISIENFHGNLHAGNISGVQNRVNQGSSDNSTNFKNAKSVFDEVDRVANDLNNETRDAVKTIMAEMRDAECTPSRFAAAYGKFVSIAADHVALMPFIPALATLVPS